MKAALGVEVLWRRLSSWGSMDWRVRNTLVTLQKRGGLGKSVSSLAAVLSKDSLSVEYLKSIQLCVPLGESGLYLSGYLSSNSSGLQKSDQA